MISYLKGIVLEKSAETATILINETMGYELFVPEDDLIALKEKQEVAFFCYHHKTERSEELYGFVARERKNLFKLLIENVTGVGPKSALKIVAKDDAARIRAAIAKGDHGLLAAIGIGRKTAEKIIAGLKGKIQAISDAHLSTASTAANDALQALVSLGYTRTEAETALRKIEHQGKTTETILKESLTLL